MANYSAIVHFYTVKSSKTGPRRIVIVIGYGLLLRFTVRLTLTLNPNLNPKIRHGVVFDGFTPLHKRCD